MDATLSLSLTIMATACAVGKDLVTSSGFGKEKKNGIGLKTSITPQRNGSFAYTHQTDQTTPQRAGNRRPNLFQAHELRQAVFQARVNQRLPQHQARWLMARQHFTQHGISQHIATSCISIGHFVTASILPYQFLTSTLTQYGISMNIQSLIKESGTAKTKTSQVSCGSV